jgi:hypothetical protein
MITHDLFIGEFVLSKIGGPTEFYSPTLAWYKGIGENISRTAYLSGLELGLAYANSVVTLGCWAVLMWWTLSSTRDSAPRLD